MFLFVCAETDSQWGQRVSVAPCVAYKLINDKQGWGNCTPLPTFCEYVRVVFRVRGRKKISLGTQEACGLKLVLENGLQIVIGSSGSTNLHTHVQWNRSQQTVFVNPQEFLALSLLFMIFQLTMFPPLTSLSLIMPQPMSISRLVAVRI